MRLRPEFEFWRAQAAFDLIWLLQSLDNTQLAGVGGESFPAIVRDLSCRFDSASDAPCYEELISKTLEDTDDAHVAVAMIVANDLQSGRWSGDAKEIAEFAKERVRRAPNEFRSAILRGLDALEEATYGKEPTECFLPEVSRLTRSVDLILPKLCAIARAMDLPTRESVAAADYGDETAKHLEALEKVLEAENCQFLEGEVWYPNEVVELVSHGPTNKGFVSCTALLLANALLGNDIVGWFDYRWSKLAADYNALPESVRAPILAGLRYLYEIGEPFSPYNRKGARDSFTAREGMIAFVELSDEID